MSHSILVVDDEQDILDLLQFNLEKEGYRIQTAKDGDHALDLARRIRPDLIILDIMLPKKDGWTVLRELRFDQNTKHIPIIFLTARDSEIDEVVGLELGADDYIVKPISIRKLIARVNSALRKSKERPTDVSGVLRFNGLEIDPERFLVLVDGQEVKLTKKEFQILVFLAQRPGRVITRDQLLNQIWGYDVVVIDRTIDVHIRKIREKLGEKYMNLIETIKGVGYRFRAE